MIPQYTHGVHDTDGAHLMDGYPGWLIITEAIGHDPNDRSGRDYSEWSSRGLGVIVRLNNAHNGVDGTIPAPQHYRDFAQRCANFVQASQGIAATIIGNEPNHANEWPHGAPIDALDYARCYSECLYALRNVRRDLPVLVAAVAPWNGDWVSYLQRVVNNVPTATDGFALHAYTHGADPQLITSNEIQHGWFWHFRVYRQQLTAIRDIVGKRSASMLFVITEANQGDDAWVDADSGWVQAAYREVDAWNQANPELIVRGLCLYRTNTHDKWSIADKPGVQRDFRRAVERGYKTPLLSSPATPQRELPQPQPAAPSASASAAPTTPTVNPMSQRLLDFGATLKVAAVQPGQTKWEIVSADGPLDRGGNVNIYVDVLDEQGQRLVGVPVEFYWADDHRVYPTEAKPGEDQAVNMPIYAGGNAYGVRVADGTPSDDLFGMGLVPFETHKSYKVVFQRKRAATQPVPMPGQPTTILYVVAPAGANLRAEASAQSALVIAIPYGQEVEARGEQRGADGAMWTVARYGIQSGWIRSDLLGATKPPVPNPTPTSAVPALVHPIADPAKRVVSQIFGVNAPRYAKWNLAGHNGVDYAVEVGTPIRAVADGVVSEAAIDAEGYGVYVKLVHGWGESLYAHLHQWAVGVGQRVTGGQTLGLSGNTGNSTGPHLHFGLRTYPAKWGNGFNGYVDPLPYLNTTAAPSQPIQPAPTRAELMAIVKAAAAEAKVDWRLLASLIQAESSFDPNSLNPESGARGLGNIMPNTWAEWSAKVGVRDIFDPTDNARVTAAYLAWCIEQAGNERKGLWAYNWGIGRVQAGRTPPAETVDYASKVQFGRDLLVVVGA